MVIDIVILIFAGFLSGILSSLFGLGGGLIIVPILALVLPLFNIPHSAVIHVAVGTSLAIMFVNSANSMRSHHFAGNIKWVYFYKIVPYIILGTIIGAVIASFLTASVLILAFIVFLVVVIIRFIKHLQVQHEKQFTCTKYPVLFQRMANGVATGIVSACIGGGSSLLMVPFLKRCGLQIKQSVALSTTFNVLIAFIATLSYSFLGSHLNNLPRYTTGFIFWPAFVCITIGTFCGVPVGTWLSNRLSEKTLTVLYFLLLLGIFVTMSSKYLLSL